MDLKIFLTEFLAKLEMLKVPFCILRNYEKLPIENTGNDIDFLIRELDKPVAVSTLRSIPGIQITGYIDRGYVTSVFVHSVEWGIHKAVQIDLITSLSWKGLNYLDTEEVFRRSFVFRKTPLIPVPHPVDEAVISLFSSYLVGGWIKEKYLPKIKATFSQYTKGSVSVLSYVYGEPTAKKIVESVITDNHPCLYRMLPEIKLKTAYFHLKKRPISSMARIALHYAKEILIRYTPYALSSVCFLGSDGAGKSTVITDVREQLKHSVKLTDIHHLKPTLFKKTVNTNVIVDDPHNMPLRSAPVSMLKILSWLFLFRIDLILHGRKSLVLRLWDRYYHDILVDPKRYRYGGPLWFARSVGRLVPQPDLWILLDAPPEVVQERKKEVPFNETERQRKAYIDLVKGFENAVIIDASRPIGDVVIDVKKTILSMMVEKTKNQLNL